MTFLSRMRSRLTARRLKTVARYYWWHPLMHLVILGFGLLNLYPFLWMVGTSFKAEAEASTNRMSPFPVAKHRLAPGVSLPDLLPLALEPGLRELRPDMDVLLGGGERELPGNVPASRKRCAKLLDSLEKKLKVIHRLQLDAGRGVLVSSAARYLRREPDDEVRPAVEEASRLAKAVADAKAALEEAMKREGAGGGTGSADVRRIAAGLAALSRDSDEAGRRAEAACIERAKALVSSLAAKGLLEEAEGGVWLAEAPPAGATKALSASERSFLRELTDYLSVTVKEAANVVACPAGEAEAALDAMVAAGGALAEIAPAGPERERRFVPGRGMRGRFGPDGLLPRQALTLWSMREENIRRSESRVTYPADSRSVGDYSEAMVKDPALAEADLQELREKGLLTGATLQPVNYWVILKDENFLLHFLTTAIITAFVVMGTILLSSMLGYALARIRFPGKFLILGVMVAASILPGEARQIPTFKMLLATVGMDSLWPVVLWLTSFGVGNALLMAGFFLTLPKEVDEAAQVDGAGPFRTFFDVALPMARPIVMTVGLFAFLNAWNNFMVPLICTISRPSMQPLAVAVYNFQQGHPGKWQEINAAASVMVIPVIILFLFVQKHVVKSIAVGAVKG